MHSELKLERLLHFSSPTYCKVMYGKRLIALIVIVSSIYGQSLAPELYPQRLYAVYSDASISNISLVSSREELLLPSNSDGDITIPLSCYNPLQCGITPQQNGFSVIYIPNEEHSSLILLKLEGEMLYAQNITVPCIFNDFILQPNVHDFPLVVACELTAESSNTVRYVLFNPYGNVTRDDIETVPDVHPAVVSPIILKIPQYNDGEVEDSSNIFVVSINTRNRIVIYGVQNSELDTSSLQLDQPCVPLHIRKQSNIAFLLTCQGGHSYLVNTSAGIPNINLVSIPNPVTAIANNLKYSLALTVINSTGTATIQELLSQPAAVRTIRLNATMIYGAGFGPDDKFAYVATDREIIFINVLMGLEGVEQFTHTIPIPVCSQCPAVMFLSNVTALVSSSDTPNNVIIQFFDLSRWPPLNSLNRTLSKQPKVYWHNDQYIQPTPTISQTTLLSSSLNSPSVSSTSYGSDTLQNDGLSDGAIVGIVAAAVFGVVVVVVILIVIIYIFVKRCNEDDEAGIPPLQLNNREQMVPGIDLDPNIEPVQATS